MKESRTWTDDREQNQDEENSHFERTSSYLSFQTMRDSNITVSVYSFANLENYRHPEQAASRKQQQELKTWWSSHHRVRQWRVNNKQIKGERVVHVDDNIWVTTEQQEGAV